MSAQECFSFVIEAPFLHSSTSSHTRRSSTESNASLRSLLGSWATLTFTPPSCRTVSFSSWSRFTTSSAATAPSGELKSSVLCRGGGLTASYDPPASEWVYLGVNQHQAPAPAPSVNKANAKPSLFPKARNQRQRSSPTAGETREEDFKTEPMEFRKQALKRVNTNSQLTSHVERETFQRMPKKMSMMERMVKELGLQGVRCEELPSAFDSDSEDDD